MASGENDSSSKQATPTHTPTSPPATSFNAAFDATTEKYRRSVSFLAGRKWIALAGIAVFGAAFYVLMRTTPTGFVPSEDMGVVMSDISLPPGASQERTAEVVEEIAKIKLPDLNAESLEAAVKTVAGTARSMGLDVIQ